MPAHSRRCCKKGSNQADPAPAVHHLSWSPPRPSLVLPRIRPRRRQPRPARTGSAAPRDGLRRPHQGGTLTDTLASVPSPRAAANAGPRLARGVVDEEDDRPPLAQEQLRAVARQPVHERPPPARHLRLLGGPLRTDTPLLRLARVVHFAAAQPGDAYARGKRRGGVLYNGSWSEC